MMIERFMHFMIIYARIMFNPSASGFQILKRDKKTKARLGLLKTAHGKVKTSAYVFVGTYGRIRHLSPADIKKTGTQLIIANTFHLWEQIQRSKFKGQNDNSKFKSFLTDKLQLNIPTMTDSGGFQVLSLAFDDKNRVGMFMKDGAKKDNSYQRNKIKIGEKGVHFLFDGKWKFLGPELSMKIQEKIGADIIFAFDHITSPLDDYEYNKKAVELTDAWARDCLKWKMKNGKWQMLFGIVQGGLFRDLRIKSARSIGSMPFDGFGIGGSYTKKQIARILKWVIPHLPEEKPRHLLGVGKVDDIFEAVENGIDVFDCVIPTREARHGRLYTRTGHMDIRRGSYTTDKKVIEKGCGCPACKSGITRAQIRACFKGQPSNTTSTFASRGRRHVDVNILGQRYCLMHNMWFFNNLLENIRAALSRGSYQRFKKKTLASFSKQQWRRSYPTRRLR